MRDTTHDELVDAGFEVVTAASGEDPIRIIRSGAEFDLLFTDIRLGAGPNGWEVAHAFRQVWPGCPVVYASG